VETPILLINSGKMPEEVLIQSGKTVGGLTDVQQKLIRRCWDGDDSKRPKMVDVVGGWKSVDGEGTVNIWRQ
jgi:hypothetical protein